MHAKHALYHLSYIPELLELQPPSKVSVCKTKLEFTKKMWGDARIELATSCTLSKNHTTRPITLSRALSVKVQL